MIVRESVQTPMSWAGWALLICGLGHLPLVAFTGEDWSGPISWRKPVLFGLSTGLTLWSMGWLASRLPAGRWDRFFGWLTAGTLLVEVGLITLQKWFGRASHFNQETAWDRGVDQAMFWLICLAFSGIVYFAIRSAGRLQTTADYRLAIRGGMAFLVLSCLVGFAISIHGYRQIQLGRSPGWIGSQGVAKFPHGITIHALQLFPLYVLIARRLKIPAKRRKSALIWLGAASLFQLFFALHQSWNGLQRLDLQTVAGTTLFAAAAFCLLQPTNFVLRSLWPGD